MRSRARIKLFMLRELGKKPYIITRLVAMGHLSSIGKWGHLQVYLLPRSIQADKETVLIT